MSSLKELASRIANFKIVHVDILDVDVKIAKLTVREQQDLERLIDSCSIGSGDKRTLSNLPKLAYNLVKKYFTDANGEPLAGSDTEADAADWPAELVTELLTHFRRVNKLTDESDPNS
jgi:hypothetical protein